MKAILTGKKLGLEEVTKTYKGETKRVDILHLLQGYETTSVRIPKEIYSYVAEIPDNEDIAVEAELNVFQNKIYPVACGVMEK